MPSHPFHAVLEDIGVFGFPGEAFCSGKPALARHKKLISPLERLSPKRRSRFALLHRKARTAFPAAAAQYIPAALGSHTGAKSMRPFTPEV